jgi:hypothetical protein
MDQTMQPRAKFTVVARRINPFSDQCSAMLLWRFSLPLAEARSNMPMAESALSIGARYDERSRN